MYRNAQAPSLKVPRTLLRGVFVFIMGFQLALACGAAEIVALTSNASFTAMSELGPLFEKATGHKVHLRFSQNPILKQQVESGAEFDLIVIEPEMLDDLAKQGRVSREARANLARVGMGLVAKGGSPAQDTSSAEAFKKVLRDAHSIAYSGDGFSGTVFLRTLDKLQIRQELEPRLKGVVGRAVQPLVAAGEFQFYAGPVSTPAPGTQLVGHFPEELQTYIGISVALSSTPRERQAALAFLDFLRGPEAAATFARKGFLKAPPP